MIFSGHWEHTMDDKGRVVFPRAYRGEFGAGGFITLAVDGCLSIMNEATFESDATQMSAAYRDGDRERRDVARAFMAAATPFSLDKAGRIAVPQDLRAYAGLEKDCVFVGMFDRIELWDAQAWERSRSAGDMARSDPEGSR